MGFHEGFTAITGETGAGKSIMVGALNLVLGQRADTQVLRDKNQKCIIEAGFSIDGYGLEPLFNHYDLDFEKVSLLRREITPQGKSRAFINDTPVNLSTLKEFGDRLLDIHSQNQTLELNESGFQLEMLDSYSGSASDLDEYARCFELYQKQIKELKVLMDAEHKSDIDREYLEFQYGELSSANLTENEQSEAEAELEVLTHAEDIRSRLYSALLVLHENDSSVISGLSEAKQSLDQASRFSNAIAPYFDRLDACYIELKELARELSSYADSVQSDPERLQRLSDRLDLIYRLEQKHKVSTVSELLDIQSELSNSLSDLGSLKDKIEILKIQIDNQKAVLTALAEGLTKKRIAAISGIEKEMDAILADLGMPSARFRIKLTSLADFSGRGLDKVDFLFSANKGGEMKEIHKAASGGELSRLMLAIKSLIVSRSMLPTVLFDEIDSGVSGEIAGKIGNIMKRMSKTVQVVAITHLPQIAAKCNQHLLAFKLEDEKGTISSLRILDNEERINEVARMLSDHKITDTSRAAALELMSATGN